MYLILVGSVNHARMFLPSRFGTSIWFRIILTQIITKAFKDSHIDIPARCRYLIDITILKPTDGSFDTIINVDY